MKNETMSQIDGIIHPQSVAVVGASAAPGKVGRMFMDRYVEAGFETIYPINPKENEILGYKAYPRVSDVPGQVDLVHVLLPPKAVENVVNDCIQKGVKGIIITSASFGLEDDSAKTREKELVRRATENGVRIIGPNCLGIYCPKTHLPFPLGPSMDRGSIGIVTQSGSFADLLTKIATTYGVYFSKAISCGNESDLNAVDFLEYIGNDPDTKVILAYLEGIKNGRKFNELAGKITRQKPILAWKCGASEAGAMAAASHTGALAGARHIWDGVFKSSGIIAVDSLEEALDALYMFNTQPLPNGNRVAVATGPGGPAVGTMDTCTELGLSASILSDETSEKIKKIIPPFGSSAQNPVDLSIAAIEMPQMYRDVIKLLDADDNVDMIIVIGIGGKNFWDTLIDAKKEIQKPIAVASIHPMNDAVKEYQTLLGNQIPVYGDPKRAAKALAKLAAYAGFQRNLP